MIQRDSLKRLAMSPQLRRASLTALAVVVAAGVVAGFASASSSSKVHRLHVIVTKAHTETLDFPPAGKSPGDLSVFDATVVAPNGRTVVGRLRGSQTDIKLERGAETVQGMLTFELGRGNQIVVGGLAAFPLGVPVSGLVTRRTFVRAVLGGTGKYAGVKGTLTTRRLSNGNHDEVFRLTY
jgi:hypothetical protein